MPLPLAVRVMVKVTSLPSMTAALLVAALFALWQLLHLFVGGDALPSPMAAARRLQSLVDPAGPYEAMD